MPRTRRFPVDSNLVRWLQDLDRNQPDCFPPSQGPSYFRRYEDISAYLDRSVHTEVEKGALVAQLKNGATPYDKAIYLNNHGPGHVANVINRASDLLQELGVELSPFEGYLLLGAIQFHDVGNIFGRSEHEKKCIGLCT